MSTETPAPEAAPAAPAINPFFLSTYFCSQSYSAYDRMMHDADEAGVPWPRLVYSRRAGARLVGRQYEIWVSSDAVYRLWNTRRTADPFVVEMCVDDVYNTIEGVRPPRELALTECRMIDITSQIDRFRRRYMQFARDARLRSSPVLQGGPSSPHYSWDRQYTYKLIQEAKTALAESVRDVIASLDSGFMYPDVNSLIECAERLYSVTNRNRFLGSINDALDDRGWSGGALQRFNCGHFGFDADAHGTADGLVCDECFEDYRLCADDDEYHHRDVLSHWESDDEYHFDPEPDVHEASHLLGYSTNALAHLSVDPSFSTSVNGDFHMGIELETVLVRGGVNSKIRDVRDELGLDYLIAKRDGSLEDNPQGGVGIEWVTRPTSLATHIAKLSSWTDSRANLVAWDAECCGMHVHIDANAFTPLSLGKMIQFYNDKANVSFIRSLAGRHPAVDGQAQEYADWDVPHEVRTDRKINPIKALKGKPTSNRYTMVNLTNLRRRTLDRLGIYLEDSGSSDTVEIRIFRATMRKSRQLAQVEFAHALVMFCRVAGFLQINAESFKSWLAERTGQYPYLARFLNIQPNKHGAFRAVRDATHDSDEETGLEPAPAQIEEDPPPHNHQVLRVEEASTFSAAEATAMLERVARQLDASDVPQEPRLMAVSPAVLRELQLLQTPPPNWVDQTATQTLGYNLSWTIRPPGDVVRIDTTTTGPDPAATTAAAPDPSYDPLSDDIQF